MAFIVKTGCIDIVQNVVTVYFLNVQKARRTPATALKSLVAFCVYLEIRSAIMESISYPILRSQISNCIDLLHQLEYRRCDL